MTLDILLMRLGFPKESARIYEQLEKSAMSPSDLAHQLNLHRPAIYRVLRALEGAGLIYREVRGKRHRYRAHTRARLTALFTRAADGLETLVGEHEVSDIPPGLIRFVQGDTAIGDVFNDVLAHLKRGDTFLRFTSERNLDEVNALLPKDYRARRDAKRLERLVISNAVSGRKKRPRLERFIKFLGDERNPFDQNAIELIYGTKVALIDLNTRQALIIDNKTFANFHAALFRALYRRL